MSQVIGAIDEIVRDLEAPRQCLQCREWFTEMDSMGSLHCRRHTGMLQTVTTVYGGTMNTYTCCRTSPFGNHPDYRGPEAKLGCVRCDHSADQGVPPDIVLPTERAQVFFGTQLANRNVIYDERSDTVTIARHQLTAASR